jgi:CheY-like chemotaxis protein
MPVMDGYEATKRLRSQPQYAQLPIIAMTAHVTVEVRERCRALGMADHIGKPIDPQELNRLLGRFRHTMLAHPAPERSARYGSAGASPSGPLRQAPGSPALDIDAGLRRSGGAPKFYARLIEAFDRQFRGFAAKMRTHLEEGRLADATRLAHSLKGVAATLGATRLAASAEALEKRLGRDEPTGEALANAAEDLHAALNGLQQWLHANGHPTSPNVQNLGTGAHTSAASTDWVANLRSLLREGDVRAQNLWSERGSELMASLPIHTYGQIRRSIESFEFEAALNLLATVASPADEGAMRE